MFWTVCTPHPDIMDELTLSQWMKSIYRYSRGEKNLLSRSCLTAPTSYYSSSWAMKRNLSPALHVSPQTVLSCNKYSAYHITTIHEINTHKTVDGTEYISVIEGTAPPSSSKHLTLQTSPPACSGRRAGIVQYTADRAGRGWESQIFGRRRGVLSLLSLIYILSNEREKFRTFYNF